MLAAADCINVRVSQTRNYGMVVNERRDKSPKTVGENHKTFFQSLYDRPKAAGSDSFKTPSMFCAGLSTAFTERIVSANAISEPSLRAFFADNRQRKSINAP